MNWIPVPLRLVMTAVFIGHGSQKVLGSFGGPGFKAFIAYPAPFPFMRPAWVWMAAAAFAELIGGILLFFGFLTRIGAFLIACVMLTAIFGVLWPNGFFVPKGYEYPLTILAITIALLISGGGAASVDRALTSGRR